MKKTWQVWVREKKYLKYIKLSEIKQGIDAGLSEIDHDCFTVFSSATFWTW